MPLAAGKAAGHVRKTPQTPPIQKKTQFHCSLSNATVGILCTFQCDSKEELNKHIDKSHKRFPCVDRGCTVVCNSLDNLASHVTRMHKKTQD